MLRWVIGDGDGDVSLMLELEGIASLFISLEEDMC